MVGAMNSPPVLPSRCFCGSSPSALNQGSSFTLVSFPLRTALPLGYDLLDGTPGTAFVHVRYRDAEAVGDLFSSDVTNGSFEISLANQSSSFSPFFLHHSQVEAM